MFQSIILVNANNTENQPDPEVTDLSDNLEETSSENSFDPEGKDYFDVEKIFDKLIHGQL